MTWFGSLAADCCIVSGRAYSLLAISGKLFVFEFQIKHQAIEVPRITGSQVYIVQKVTDLRVPVIA
jgi:hypothetical protein